MDIIQELEKFIMDLEQYKRHFGDSFKEEPPKPSELISMLEKAKYAVLHAKEEAESDLRWKATMDRNERLGISW